MLVDHAACLIGQRCGDDNDLMIGQQFRNVLSGTNIAACGTPNQCGCGSEGCESFGHHGADVARADDERTFPVERVSVNAPSGPGLVVLVAHERWPLPVEAQDHTAATMLLVLGVPGRAVMDVMGWSHIGLTTRYQHITSELLTSIADQVGTFFWPNDGHDSDDDDGSAPQPVPV